MLEQAWFRLAPIGIVALATGLVLVTGSLAIGAVAAIAVMVVVAMRPSVGAYIYLGATPLVAGISRDLFLPVLRPHEALLALIVGGLLLRGVARMLAGHRYAPVLSRVDIAVVVLALTGSLLSLIWRFSQGGDITADDILYAAVFWKYLALYVVFRVAVREPAEARIALWVALAASAVVGAIGILQALGLFGVPELLFRLYPPFLGDTAEVGRGASTLALTFAVADISLICLGAAVVLLREATGRSKKVLLGLVILFFLSAIGAGQFSGFIGIGVAIVALGFALGEVRRVLRFALPASILGAVALSPVIAQRVSGFQTGDGLPQSWSGRIDNMTRFILPEFGNGWNLIFGVRPAARVPAPETWREWVFIESGYVWLLWTGGIPLLVAFCWFVVVCLRMLKVTIANHATEIRAIATGAFVGIWVIAVLTIFDPHLTMRGVADLIFPFLAMSQIARIGSTSSDRRSTRQVVAA
jgi:hypothetical protein